MKVVFLDIDGVIATNESLYKVIGQYYGVKRGKDYLKRVHSAWDSSPLPHPMLSADRWPFCHNAIAQLFRLHRETGCKFVVSSSWRYSNSADDIKRLEELFHLKGLCIRVHDVTIRTSKAVRGLEIKEWLNRHPEVESFVILDDEAFDIVPHYPNQLVQTTQQHGLKATHVDKAIALLNLK